MNPKELLDHFENRREATVNKICEIVEIESPTSNIEGSKAVVDWLEKRVKEILPEATTERIFAEKYGEHLIIRAYENSDAKPIFFLGHTDTVHPVGSNSKTRLGLKMENFTAAARLI